MNLIEYLKSKSLCVEDVKEMNIDCNDECFICLDNIKPNEYFITPKIHEDPNFCKCKYILHLKCLKVWYRNKVVLEATDTLTAESDVNNSLDVALTIMEIT